MKTFSCLIIFKLDLWLLIFFMQKYDIYLNLIPFSHYTFYTQGILIIRYIKITLSPNLYLKLKDRVWLFSCVRVGYFKDMRWESSVLAPCVPNNFWLTDDLRLVIRCELSPKSSDISDGMNRKRIKILMIISVWDSPLEASVILA